MESISLFTEKGYLHGGIRKGAGRKRKQEPRKPHSLSCTDKEFALIKAYLQHIRNTENNAGECNPTP